MIQILPEQFENILPLAVEWAEAKEKVILENGKALSPQYMEDTKSVGVKYPGRVRIYEVPQIPIAKHPILRVAAEATQLISPATMRACRNRYEAPFIFHLCLNGVCNRSLFAVSYR
jgi:hypothetical protein